MIENTVMQSLHIMLYGLIGVFAALTVIYAAIRIVVKVFPNDHESV